MRYLINRPVIGLAPMHQVTNSFFRLECKKAGADLVYTEMVAAEAVIRNVPKAFEMMSFEEVERPIAIQIFGSNADSMARAAKIIEKELTPDMIDINLGCPVQKAEKQGFGSCQLKDPQAVAKIIKAIKSSVKLPISVKMRLVSKIAEDTVSFVRILEKAGVSLVAIHGRTPTQKYGGHADWELMHKVKKHFPNLIILGNGDIETTQDFKDKLGNLDGVLIGRAAKRDPEIFSKIKSSQFLQQK